MEKFFFGKNVEWWFGIVEKRNSDPSRVGCCKVRLFGHHTGDKALMPTEALPDAYPAVGLGGSLFATPREGDTVMGIFLDEGKQNLAMLFKIDTEEQNVVFSPDGDGFKDARTTSELVDFPRQKIKNYEYSTTGVVSSEFDAAFIYPPYGPQVSSVPFLARAIEEKIPAQIAPATKKAQAQATRYSTSRGDVWFELPSEYAAVYPFNHVYESESLHTLEFDDTPSAERVKIMHRLGSSIEFFPDGSAVFKSVKDDYRVVLGDSKVGISGKSDITVNGDATLLVKGDMTTHINGNYQLSVDGDFKRVIKGNEISQVTGDAKHKAGGTMIQRADGGLWVKGSPLNWNSGSTPEVDSITDFDLPELPENTLSIENQAKLIELTGSPISPKDDNGETTPPVQGQTVPAPNPTPLDCPVVEDNLKPFGNGDSRYRMQLSKYYQLADLTIRPVYPHQVAAQNGLKTEEIICNLAFLSQNSLDPISSQFPGARINCGFRKTQNGTSQHEFGEASDLQWPSIRVGSLSKYMDIANWIIANAPFDQLIMEHGNTIWLHISLKKTGTNRKQILTMKDGVFSSGLNLFGRV